jgi:alpha-pyrone synthase
MTRVYLNKIATAVPPHDVHKTFVEYAPNLLSSEHDRKIFRMLTQRAQIEHRFSVLEPHAEAAQFDANDFYRPNDFPATKERMALYKKNAFPLASQALQKLDIEDSKDSITHIIVTSCTGFYAPGLDQDIIRHHGLNPTVERTIVGFMGCQAAVNALKLSHHIVRSNPIARVLIVNLELCTLHLQDADDIDQIMSFLIFADGCATSIVSAEPVGLEILGFHSGIMPDSHAQITWHIGDTGFDMILAREVPATITGGIADFLPGILSGNKKEDITHWAVHPGGRAILDAVRNGLSLREEDLVSSRKILKEHGNMSSATLMFVLKDIMGKDTHDAMGCALAFGPGLTAESMLFRSV